MTTAGDAARHDHHAAASYGSDAALQQVAGRYVHDGPAGHVRPADHLAADEAATDALQHGHPPVRVRAWAVPTGVRVRVDGRSDGGTPAAGHRAVTEDWTGKGLLAARSVADTVRVATVDGTTSMSMEFPAATPPGGPAPL